MAINACKSGEPNHELHVGGAKYEKLCCLDKLTINIPHEATAINYGFLIVRLIPANNGVLRF